MRKIRSAIFLGACFAASCGGREYGFEREEARTPRHASADAAKAATIEALEARWHMAWARRDEPAALRQAIGALCELLEARGGADYETLVLLSRAHYLLGEIEEAKEKKLEAYEAGMRYGDLALHAIPEFRAEFEKTHTIEDAVQVLPVAAIAAIYWDAVNQGKWANEKGKLKVLFIKDKVRKMIERVLALDETWWFGAAHRYLGAYFAALPSFAGRDLDLSRRHFARAIEIAPQFFATRVLMAEHWARAANDRRAYREQLELVLGTRADVLSEVAPEQRIEQKKARRLLDEIDDFFDPEEPPAAVPAPSGGKS
jgi:hypothetical protein